MTQNIKIPEDAENLPGVVLVDLHTKEIAVEYNSRCNFVPLSGDLANALTIGMKANTVVFDLDNYPNKDEAFAICKRNIGLFGAIDGELKFIGIWQMVDSMAASMTEVTLGYERVLNAKPMSVEDFNNALEETVKDI